MPSKENRMDRVTDLVKGRLESALGEAQRQFKGTNPYRQEEVSPKERLMDFAQMTEEDIQMGYSIDEGAMNKYLASMDELLRRQK